jgi:hypothetical protein
VMLLVLPELAPLMLDPHALSKPPAPAATAPAPAPASTDRRVIGRPGSGLLPALSGPMLSPPSSNAVKPVESAPTGLIGDLPPEGLPAHIGAVRIAYNDAQYRT